jgi:hypothetical protein
VFDVSLFFFYFLKKSILDWILLLLQKLFSI